MFFAKFRLQNGQSQFLRSLTLNVRNRFSTKTPNSIPDLVEAKGNKAVSWREGRGKLTHQLHSLPNFELLFLGSGGSNPSRFKNTSCSMLNIGGENFLFDAGEGSLRQTIRAYTHSIMTTSRIFITHMHADHVLGLPSIVLHSAMNPQVHLADAEPLHVYGPPGIHSFLVSCVGLTQSTINRPVIVHELIIGEEEARQLQNTELSGKSPWRHALGHYRSPSLEEKLSYLQGGKTFEKRELRAQKDGTWICMDGESLSVKARLVSHKIPCFGFVVNEKDIAGELLVDKVKAAGIPLNSELKNIKNGMDAVFPDGTVISASDLLGPPKRGRKMTIIGDTSNASNIAELALNSDVVVHESSFDNDGAKVATKSGHATPSVAANFARKSNAKRLVINHIGSQFVSTSSTEPHIQSPNKAEFNNWKKDTDIQEEVRKSLGRPKHCVIARDYMSVSVPVGGYTLHDDAFHMSFYLPDNTIHDIKAIENSTHRDFSLGGKLSMFTRVNIAGAASDKNQITTDQTQLQNMAKANQVNNGKAFGGQKTKLYSPPENRAHTISSQGHTQRQSASTSPKAPS